MYKVVISIICFSLLIPQYAYADSARKLVNKGNISYVTGKFDEALAAYEEASVDSPESAHIYFNMGTAYYQKEDYAKAVEAFEKAALKTRDIKIEANAKFNLGNCAFREAERQQDSDLNKVLEACGKSISYFQEALERDPEFTEAAENIEVVRLVMKSILDEIKKQEEEAKNQQQAMQNAVENIKQLIENQQNLLDQTNNLSEHQQDNLKEKTEKLAEDQKNLQNETRELAANMPKPQAPQQQNIPPPANPAEKHLANAANEQGAAAEKLEQNQPDSALSNQEESLEELQKALDSLTNKQDQQQCDNKQQQQQGEQPSSPDQDENQKQDKEKQQETMAQLPDDAENILDEEKENKNRRQLQTSGGYRDVDKDW